MIKKYAKSYFKSLKKLFLVQKVVKKGKKNGKNIANIGIKNFRRII